MRQNASIGAQWLFSGSITSKEITASSPHVVMGVGPARESYFDKIQHISVTMPNVTE